MPISAQHDMASDTLIAQRIRLRGRIQGVGFRPFTVRLAQRHDVRGWVRNVGGEVEIHAEGRPEPLARFVAGLTAEAPQLARPDAPQVSAATVEHHEDFRILASSFTSARNVALHCPQSPPCQVVPFSFSPRRTFPMLISDQTNTTPSHVFDATAETFQQDVLEKSLSTPVLLDFWAE